jgi:hypothetical protein
MVKSMDLREQKEMLLPTDEPHPYQLQDLSQVSKGTISSIAEILKQVRFWYEDRKIGYI